MYNLKKIYLVFSFIENEFSFIYAKIKMFKMAVFFIKSKILFAKAMYAQTSMHS